MTSDFSEYKRPAASGNMHAGVYLHSQAPRTMSVGRSEHPSKREYSFKAQSTTLVRICKPCLKPPMRIGKLLQLCSESGVWWQVSGSFGLSALHVSEQSSCLLHSSCWTWRVILIPTWEACFSIQLECSALSTLLRVFSVVLFSSQVSTLFYSSALLCSAWVLRLVSLDLTRRHQWWQIIRLLCHHLLSKKTKICSTSRQIIAGLL